MEPEGSRVANQACYPSLSPDPLGYRIGVRTRFLSASCASEVQVSSELVRIKIPVPCPTLNVPPGTLSRGRSLHGSPSCPYSAGKRDSRWRLRQRNGQRRRRLATASNAMDAEAARPARGIGPPSAGARAHFWCVDNPANRGAPLFRNAASTYNGYISECRGPGSVYVKYLAS